MKREAREGCRRAQPGASHSAGRDSALTAAAIEGDEHRSGVRPKRTTIVELYTAPRADATFLCVDELGPVSSRTFLPAPGWLPDHHRIKALLEYSRGPDGV